MSWIDGSTLFLLIAQFGGVVKLLYMAGEVSAEIRDLRRRVTNLENCYER